MSTLKIAIVGPKGVGKSTFANALAGDFTEYDAMPTVGCRIREYRQQLVSEDSSAEVELWDISGDLQYENCWPAVAQGLNGLVIVYDPTNQLQSKEVSLWMEAFCKNSDLQTGQVAIFALNLPQNSRPPPVKYQGKKSQLQIPIVGLKVSKNPKSMNDLVFNGMSFSEFVDACYKLHPDHQELNDEDDAFLDGQ
mmetsp:Transcript_29421/g.51651  ORF Transcript_29421/g.51651 Transcript_29421/m.51651 type:complete len:194 (+) Transcript_29421:93-674(+)|eukprot:CAMPEP_0197517420 /NCGR_PEP_ID=MMETSP1318-20131121/2419_1 /TAXON_ID=552666 /ORGANISM="Partenskyella glossopodia, Strain RCC365" /LENGTH=193 /DNA_ID=CAMNT_0043066951 /DNA_START=93 /DNA_END=674 /DNA_ORIENTATION=+